MRFQCGTDKPGGIDQLLSNPGQIGISVTGCHSLTLQRPADMAAHQIIQECLRFFR